MVGIANENYSRKHTKISPDKPRARCDAEDLFALFLQHSKKKIDCNNSEEDHQGKGQEGEESEAESEVQQMWGKEESECSDISVFNPFSAKPYKNLGFGSSSLLALQNPYKAWILVKKMYNCLSEMQCMCSFCPLHISFTHSS